MRTWCGGSAIEANSSGAEACGESADNRTTRRGKIGAAGGRPRTRTTAPHRHFPMALNVTSLHDSRVFASVQRNSSEHAALISIRCCNGGFWRPPRSSPLDSTTEHSRFACRDVRETSGSPDQLVQLTHGYCCHQPHVLGALLIDCVCIIFRCGIHNRTPFPLCRLLH